MTEPPSWDFLDLEKAGPAARPSFRKAALTLPFKMLSASGEPCWIF